MNIPYFYIKAQHLMLPDNLLQLKGAFQINQIIVDIDPFIRVIK